MTDSTGLRVVITAAGSGIGRATAERFANDGAAVWTCDVDAAALSDACERTRIDGMVADVSNTASVDAFMATGHRMQRRNGR